MITANPVSYFSLTMRQFLKYSFLGCAYNLRDVRGKMARQSNALCEQCLRVNAGTFEYLSKAFHPC